MLWSWTEARRPEVSSRLCQDAAACPTSASLSPPRKFHAKCVTLLVEGLLGLGDQGGSLGIKTTEFSQKSEPRKVWPLDLVCVWSMVAFRLPE